MKTDLFPKFQATPFLVCHSIFDVSDSSDLLIPGQDQQLSPDKASDSSQDPFGPDPLSFPPASPLSVQTLGSASSEALDIYKFLEDLAAHGPGSDDVVGDIQI